MFLRQRPFLLAAASCLLYVSPSRAAMLPDDEPPAVGRPPYFSGAVGSFREARVEAQPTQVQVQDPLTLILRVTADGPVQRPPRKPDLRQFPAFVQQFHIEDVETDEPPPDARGWEFVYRLKPKHRDVTAIPSLPFVFYKPGIVPPRRGYQTLRTASIPLTVLPREQVQPDAVQGGLPLAQGPASLYQFAEGPTVLRREAAVPLPGPGVLALLLLAPPMLCAAWYMIWRHRYPTAARLARQRHSRAARQALKALHAAARRDGEQAHEAAAVMARYLQQRLNLVAAEPTPAEAAACLERAGFPPALREQVARFFRDCDAARFAPAAVPPPDGTAAAAVRLILTLESEPWPSATS